MAKRWYVHGTNYEAYDSIEKNGFNWKHKKCPWAVSNQELIYLRCIDEINIENEEIANLYGYDSDEVNSERKNLSAVREVLCETIANANISASFNNSKSKSTAYYFFYVDDKDVSIDDSCNYSNENKDKKIMMNCYSISDETANKTKKFVLLTDTYVPFYRIFYIGNFAFSNNYTDQELFNNSEFYYEYEEKLLFENTTTEIISEYTEEVAENGLHQLVKLLWGKMDEYKYSNIEKNDENFKFLNFARPY